MLTKTLIAALVVASTTVGFAQAASAAPMRERVVTHESVGIRHEPPRIAPAHEARPIVVRDWNRDRGFERAPRIEYRPRFGFAAAPIVVAPVVEPVIQPAMQPMVFDLGGAAGTGIELASTGGATFVQQVQIRYEDGRTAVLPVDQEVDAQQPSLELATDGAPIAAVQVMAQGAALSVTAV